MYATAFHHNCTILIKKTEGLHFFNGVQNHDELCETLYSPLVGNHDCTRDIVMGDDSWFIDFRHFFQPMQ